MAACTAMITLPGALQDAQPVIDALGCDSRFNTLCFLLVFAPIVIGTYWALPGRRAKQIWLTATSFVFYSFWDWRFAGLILFSSLVDFTIAQRMMARPKERRKPWLIASICVNLGLLAFFKYALFARDNFQGLLDLTGAEWTLPRPEIVLPVGISFYTFQTMSYTIDVYRGDVAPTRDLVKYLAFVSMFPQLVAGPIVRYRHLDAQLDAIPARLESGPAARGLELFAMGLIKKVAVADTIALWIDPIWAQPEGIDAMQATLASFGFAVQVYFDFAGYSEMALGLGMMLGLRLPTNFRGPYLGRNPSDLWRRWHISLTTFIRDYVYIPLGGNRVSARRMWFNTLMVMVLMGAWHQASWTMIFFGAYQTVYVMGYRSIQGTWDAWPDRVQQGLTILGWVGGLIMFRAVTVADAWSVYSGFMRAPAHISPTQWQHLFVILGVLAFTMIAKPIVDRSDTVSRRRAAWAGILMAAGVVLSGQESPSFIYFQF